MEFALRQLLALLQPDAFLTGVQLAQGLGVSERTVRTKLGELAKILELHGAALEAKRRAGYRLVIRDQAAFSAWRESLLSHEAAVPTTSGGRVEFMLSHLLGHNEYVKLEDLSALLYVSRGTVTADLKRVESILDQYHLTIHRRPNYGIRLEGEEFNRRICIAKELIPADVYDSDARGEGALLKVILSSVIKDLHLSMTEGSFRAMIIHLYVANERLRQGQGMIYPESAREELRQTLSPGALQVAQRLAGELEGQLGISYPVDEMLYLAIHLSGKVTSDAAMDNSAQRISQEMEQLATQMLEAVYQSNRVDFRTDADLCKSLVQHLIPLNTRLRFDIPLTNPILDHIKTEYSFAFVLATNACTVLREYYEKPIPQGEVGYIAILFGLAAEKRDKGMRRKNIVVVCASGRGTSQLFLYKCKQTFGQYLDQIYERTVFDLADLDFEGLGIDYVFSTVQIDTALPVPVYQVSPFLNNQETGRLQRVLEGGDEDFFPLYFDARLFLPRLKATTKEDILKKMCDHVAQFMTLEDEFYELVLKREGMGQTDFGNLVALPHAYRIASPDRFVMTAILDEPIWWGHNNAQVIFLVSLPESNTVTVERFYRAMLNVQSDPALVGRMINQPTFPTLMQVFLEAGER